MKELIAVFTLLVAISLQGVGQENSDFKANHPNVHKVVVKEVIQTTNYTYLNVQENEKLMWLAVPKMEAKEGETYYFQGGMQMGEFTSKELDRTFSEILFINGLISPDFVEKGKTSLAKSPQKTTESAHTGNVNIEKAEGGITIAELFSNKEKYADKIVKIKGKVTKYNSQIMGKNWIHLQDGSSGSEEFDFTVTSMDEASMDEVVTIEGKIVLDKDFGSGYFFSVIMENGRIIR